MKYSTVHADIGNGNFADEVSSAGRVELANIIATTETNQTDIIAKTETKLTDIVTRR